MECAVAKGPITEQHLRNWVNVAKSMKHQCDLLNKVIGLPELGYLLMNFLTCVMFAYMALTAKANLMLMAVGFFCGSNLARLHAKARSVGKITDLVS